jgi:hypothetical protein
LHLAGYSSAAAVAGSLVALWCSWGAYRRLRVSPQRPQSDARRSLVLLAGLGAGGAALLLVALALQATAGFILIGCER